MNKKEILEYLTRFNDEDKYSYSPEYLLDTEEIWLLYDYITNLQQKVEQYENPDDYTLFYMWLDSKAKDKMKQLQQENERLNNKLEKIKEIINYYAVENEDYSKIYNDEEKELLEVVEGDE